MARQIKENGEVMDEEVIEGYAVQPEPKKEEAKAHVDHNARNRKITEMLRSMQMEKAKK